MCMSVALMHGWLMRITAGLHRRFRNLCFLLRICCSVSPGHGSVLSLTQFLGRWESLGR